MKVYIGAPGSATAAGQGYVNTTQLQEIALAAQANYSTFGGVMLWDASDAYGEFYVCEGSMLLLKMPIDNNRYDKSIKEALASHGKDVSSGTTDDNPTSGSGTGTNSTVPGVEPVPGPGSNGGGADCLTWSSKEQVLYDMSNQLAKR